jgi:hypothetical protein
MHNPRFRFEMVAAAMVATAIALAPGLARAGGFFGPLVQCSAVTSPAKIASCGSDPLNGGGVAIFSDGEVTVTVAGAAPSTQYLVEFAAPDNSALTKIGALTTNSKGNGDFDKEVAFALNTVGAGNIVLINNGATSEAGKDEFYSGLAIEASGGNRARADYHPSLVRCDAVKVPSSPGSCGSDSLKSGSVDVDAADGDVIVQVVGAAASETYSVVFRAIDGTSLPVPGTLTTDSSGTGQLMASAFFPAGTIGEGEFAIQRSSADQYLSGFDITQKPPKPRQAHSTLDRCVSVTNPVLGNCGTDPLSSGTVNVGPNGQIFVSLTGAQPSTTYSVVFRPLDDSGDITVGTLPESNSNGNVPNTKFSFFTSGQVYSGAFVIVSNGLDEFVPSLETSK